MSDDAETTSMSAPSSGDDTVTVERVIPAPPEKIFELLVNPDQHQVFDGSGTVREAKGSSERLKLGSTFGMKMKMGFPYSMESEVIEFEDNRCVAWQTRPPIGKSIAGGRIWRYDLEPVDGGTRVRETWDISQEAAASKWLVGLGGARKKTRESMAKTLERIEQLVAT
jgi:uncharacterized protein YndB with AHSA1/START domain